MGERGAAGRIPPVGEDLVALLAADPQRLGVFDADVLEVRNDAGNGGEDVACEGVALGALRRSARGDGHQMWVSRAASEVPTGLRGHRSI